MVLIGKELKETTQNFNHSGVCEVENGVVSHCPVLQLVLPH